LNHHYFAQQCIKRWDRSDMLCRFRGRNMSPSPKSIFCMNGLYGPHEHGLINIIERYSSFTFRHIDKYPGLVALYGLTSLIRTPYFRSILDKSMIAQLCNCANHDAHAEFINNADVFLDRLKFPRYVSLCDIRIDSHWFNMFPAFLIDPVIMVIPWNNRRCFVIGSVTNYKEIFIRINDCIEYFASRYDMHYCYHRFLPIIMPNINYREERKCRLSLISDAMKLFKNDFENCTLGYEGRQI